VMLEVLLMPCKVLLVMLRVTRMMSLCDKMTCGDNYVMCICLRCGADDVMFMPLMRWGEFIYITCVGTV
jgi:hypothetical protein